MPHQTIAQHDTLGWYREVFIKKRIKKSTQLPNSSLLLANLELFV